MPKCYVGADEWYPVTTIQEPWDSDLYKMTELSQDLIDRWEAAKDAFFEVCREVDAEVARQHPREPVDWSKPETSLGVE